MVGGNRPYWLAEGRVQGTLCLAEGDSFQEAQDAFAEISEVAEKAQKSVEAEQ
tara:strand:- start:19121 stop:19279 length:159 start_codon:yes stop_codon:yes gene_type:complete